MVCKLLPFKRALVLRCDFVHTCMQNLWLLRVKTTCRDSCGISGYIYHLESYFYLEGDRSLHTVAAGGGAQQTVRGGTASPVPSANGTQALQHYLEIMELECDWLEEVVAALSWENPLWLDSRLVMEPLKSSEPMTSV